MHISNREINDKEKPYVIAELSGNHAGLYSNAKKIIDAAKWAGVDAIKLQTFKPELMTINSTKKNFIVNHENSKWSHKSLFSLFSKAYTPWNWYSGLKSYCKKKNITLFSSVFDLESLNFLERLDFPAYKIASFENDDLNLIQEIAKRKKPIIMSTGMATLIEINKSYNTINKFVNKDKLALLKCTSSYPAPLEYSNLRTIPDMKKRFKCQVGLSDHTIGNISSITAVSLGASIIEKHICLNKKTGIDSFFSLTPTNFKKLVEDLNYCWQSKGKIFYGATKSEKKSLKNKRSLFASKNIKKNEKLTWKNIVSLRPVIGLKSQFFNQVINKTSKLDIKKNEPIKLKMIKK